VGSQRKEVMKIHRQIQHGRKLAGVLASCMLVLLSTPHVGYAQNSRPDPRLEAIDALVSYPDRDFSGDYTMTVSRPGEGNSVTRALMFRRDSEDKFLILILEPSIDRGKGYLKIADNLWLYDPVSRRFNVTSARERFENSNARNSDFTSSTLAEDYRIVSSTEEALGAYDTTVYDLQALHDDVTFPRIRIWVDDDDLVRKKEDYSLSGQLMRTTAIPTYQRVEGRYVPVSIVIIDALRGADDWRRVSKRENGSSVSEVNRFEDVA
jgi:Outer membrane lipoprotein-sorting protein